MKSTDKEPNSGPSLLSKRDIAFIVIILATVVAFAAREVDLSALITIVNTAAQ